MSPETARVRSEMSESGASASSPTPDDVPSSARTLVEGLGIGYRYGEVKALEGFNMSVREGEIVSIVGPSGCGKTTLLSILAGLRRPTSGELRWQDGMDGAGQERRPVRRRLSLVFQTDTLLPWLTVEGNIAFGLRYIALSRPERHERIDRLLRVGGLEEFRRAYPRQLSGGMRRRAAFLAGIAPLPHLLLLDEPFSALDEPTRVSLHADVLAIVRDLDLSVVLVTHDLAEAVSISDRVCVLSKRPARVIWEVATGLGRTRDVLSVRTTSQYSDVYTQAWRTLWRAIEESD